jgi:hypothetical protein
MAGNLRVFTKKVSMEEKHEIGLRDGTVVRHKNKGYEGKIEGTTAIKACFTRAGMLLDTPLSKEAFQYRVVVNGESARCIAPAEDLEILDATSAIICVRCQRNFNTKPGLAGKPGGRCACGGWICPACQGCRVEESEDKKKGCLNQRKRFLRKTAILKK